MGGFVKRKVKSLTLGEKIKKIREKSGISLAEIASNTKIKQDYLRKIEEGDFESLPFDVYVKGFLRSYAKYLGLDPEKVVDQFKKEVGIRENMKKYQEKSEKKVQFKMPNLTITPKMASLFFSFLLVVLGGLYFYFEVDDFSKEPDLTIESPGVNTTVDASSVEISGWTGVENKIIINQQPVFVDSQGRFKEEVGLQKGVNEITVIASNKFNKNTKRIINIVADYEVAVLGERKEEKLENEEDNFVEIESRDKPVWISTEVDEEPASSSNLSPGNSLKIKFRDKIKIETGKASSTYVRINNEEFFLVDEENNGYEKIILNKEGEIEEGEDK